MEKHIRFDWAVKKMLRSKANFGILEGFLGELLKEDVKIEEILESEGNKETEKDKFDRVDILVKDSQGKYIIVEIQIITELDYFYKILYNTSKVITEHIAAGDPYTRVKKVVTVSVVYFDLGQGQDYVYHGRTVFKGIHKDDTLMLSESQKKIFYRETLSEIYPDHYVIKVNEFDDIARDNLDEWVYFLKNSEIKNEFKAKGLAEAGEKLKEINLPENERRSYKRYLQNLMDEASIVLTIRFEKQFAWEKGFEEGRKKVREEIREKEIEIGIEQGKLETVRELVKNGVDLKVIAMATGFPLERIQKLAETVH
jgi:predicted transposase/invertase (TIGR01784 family)